MKKLKLNLRLSTLVMLIIFIFSSIIIALPYGVAQEVPRKKTYAIIGAIPNPVGVNQEVLLHIGITHQLASAQYGWEGLTVSVTKPDGETETLGPFRTDSTGGTGAVYIPSMSGTYVFQTFFPEQTAPSTIIWGGVVTPEGTIMEASESEELEVIVQIEPIQFYPGNALPSQYWTRPIDAQLREWSNIAGNFLQGSDRTAMWVLPFNDDVAESAHILWVKQLQMGGLAGGATGYQAFECGDAYEGFFANSVIIGGNLYYNHYKVGFPTQEVVAVNLHTGEELWSKPLLDPEGNVLRLSFGQTFYWSSYNYHAVFPYLWATSGSTWHAFDPFDGQYVYSMENVPSGSNVYGSKGEIYRFNINTNNARMSLWNSSRVVSDEGSWGSAVMGRTFDATEGIEWTINIPEGLPGGANLVQFEGIATAIGGRQRGFVEYVTGEDKIIGIAVTSETVSSWGISLRKGHEGELLFSNTKNAPSVWAENVTLSENVVSVNSGIFTIYVPELRQHWGFDIETAEEAWGPTEPQYYLDYLGGLAIRNALYEGMLISAQYSGVVYAYDLETGNRLWSYAANDPYSEILWANNWPMRVVFFADGKIYLTHSEHSPIDPKPRGSPFICLDALTGEEVWRIDGAFRGTDWGGNAILGDSIIATYDSYDQQIYAIGKGPSKTTITIQNDVITHGSSTQVKGRVLDVSPGTDSAEFKLRFPDGVPVVSDESMSDWMLHVYKQFARPTEVTGVPVKIEIVDPNNEYS
ncbi:MAG: PQQ-binding-like beta-propeller repeat protein, partial [Candidatus Bathyarchaeota archaeon]|nr:PQQ-binding-like beta-propeller repeat protein [Candidatus Bathyarchaeum tardum]